MSENSSKIKFYSGESIPLELHKVRVVQKLHLVAIERRLEALYEAGFNTFRLDTKDVFLDMLTDSGTNALSDRQMGAMMIADDAYAGSQSFVRYQKAVEEVLGKKYLLPVHQGRAAELFAAVHFWVIFSRYPSKWPKNKAFRLIPSKSAAPAAG